MYDELVKRLHRYSENCVAYKLDADFADAVQQAADVIEELSKPRWIPVAERLPESHQYVLCCGRRGGMFVGWVASLTYNGDKKATAFVHGGSGRYITHWMPLPEPPKEE